MLEALTYQEMLRNINENMQRYGLVKDTICILFTRPDLETGRNILNSLEYYHFRTGKMVNVFLPGYGAYWNDTYPDGKVVTEINGVKWYFSNEMFVALADDMEQYSKWSYSGESELLLLNCENNILSYDGMLQFHLDDMLRDHVISSVHSFLHRLFKLCCDKDTLNQVSNVLVIDKASQIMKDKILEKLPIGLGEVFQQEKYFCIRNMSR